MSALDKAFLKAYTRQTEAPGHAGELPAAGLPPGAYLESVENDLPMLVTQPYTDGSFARIDAAHQQAGSAVGPPHMAFPESAGYGDLAIVGPYYDPATAARLSEALPAVEHPSPENTGPQTVPSIVQPEIPSPEPAESFDAGLLQEDMAPAAEPASESATAVKSATLKLPAVFLAAEETEPPQAFSPDWEVDRFSWPDICDRLLEIEERYFHHVGQRLKAATDESHHVVMVSGCRRGEGRTTLALCLARSAAAAGVQVALVDADLQNPQMGIRLGMETPCGWMAVLEGKAPLNEAAVASVEDQLTLFPLKAGENPQTEAGDGRLIQILRRISVHYPLVIVDTGPLASEDRHPFAAGDDCPVDAAIVLRDLRYTTEKKAIATAQRLQRSGIAAVGIAENFESR